MGLNAYASEQRIFYSDGPATFYGFHVSGTSFSDELHPFVTEDERAQFIERVTNGLDLPDCDRFAVAALAALATYGNEWQTDQNEYTLTDYFAAHAKAALDAARVFVDEVAS